MHSLEQAYKNVSLTRFLEILRGGNACWMIKRLSGNDTGITGGHQSGLYIPRKFMQDFLPEIVTHTLYNPTKEIDCYIPSHDCLKKAIQAKYYNNVYFPERGNKKAYNEFRLTRWIGTPIQEHSNTGSICILANIRQGQTTHFLSWVSRSLEDEDLIEYWLGQDVEPGRAYFSKDEEAKISFPYTIPSEWYRQFPTGQDIVNYVEQNVPYSTWKKSSDELLLKRRIVEFDIFSELERQEILPLIQKGFKTVDEFIKYSTTIVNRRKSRSGMSLELHLRCIFLHEQLRFETQMITEQKKRPDFLFPSQKAYRDPLFPTLRLHMLAAKTCCKDRWRQVLNEADRIQQKHLFTLQEGISSEQLTEMYHHNVIVVVPQPLMRSYPKEFHRRLINLSQFVNHIKESQQTCTHYDNYGR